MTIKMIGVRISSNYSWQDVKNLPDWNTVKNTNANWHQMKQTCLVRQPVFIEVEIRENNWETIKDSFTDWQDIKNRFTDWNEVKNW